MRNSFFLLALLSTITFFSCSNDEPQPDDKAKSISITTASNIDALAVDSEISFKVNDDKQKDVTPSATIYVDGSAISGTTFKFTEVKSYTVQAKYEGLNSNKLTVNVVKSSTVAPKGQYTTKILAHDFTGTWCGFCAASILDMKELHDSFPNNIISVMIHMGGSGPDNDGTFDYVRATEFGVEQQPTVWFNHDTNFSYLPVGSVNDYIKDKQSVGLAINYDANNDKVVIKADLGTAGKAQKIVAFLVEDDLIADQLNYDNADPNSPSYQKGEVIKNLEHDNVARAELTSSPLGDVIPAGEVTNNIYTVEYSIAGKKDRVVKIENTKVVAYILDAEGKALNAQVAKANENKDFD